MKNLTVVFDLDGTLVDTAPDLVRATNHCLKAIGAGEAPADVIVPAVGHGAAKMIEAALTHVGASVDKAKIAELFDTFITFYSENIAVDSKPYPGVPVILERLNEVGARVAVCTNKQQALARKLLQQLDLLGNIHAVAGRDTLPVHKPDPGHIIGSVILADGNPNRCIMVGDSEADIEAARRAGIPIIGADFGYSSVPIETLKPDTIIQGYGEFEAALQALYHKL